MKLRIWLVLGLLIATMQGWAAESSPETLQQNFNRKYQQYLRADSQMLLPLPTIEMAAWKHMLESGVLEKIYSEPNVYYNAKVYTLTMVRAKSGEYYLDAKGGFWGMDELAYGPFSEKDFE